MAEKPRKRTQGSIPVDRVPWHEPSLLDGAGSWETRADGTQRFSVADSQTRGVEERQARELATEPLRPKRG